MLRKKIIVIEFYTLLNCYSRVSKIKENSNIQNKSVYHSQNLPRRNTKKALKRNESYSRGEGWRKLENNSGTDVRCVGEGGVGVISCLRECANAARS